MVATANKTKMQGPNANNERDTSEQSKTRELHEKLLQLIQDRECIGTSLTLAVNELVAKYHQQDIEEAVIVTNNGSSLLRSTIGHDGSSSPVEVMQLLLDHDIDKKTIAMKDYAGDLPIHRACYCNAPVEVVQLLLTNDIEKKTIMEKNRYGTLPIHYACSNDIPVKAVRLLLEHDVDKKAIMEKENDGSLPIHRACCSSNNATAEIVRFLLGQDDENKTIEERNDDGKLPIDLAIRYDQSMETIQYLVRASVDNRLQHLGLVQWKTNITCFVERMSDLGSSYLANTRRRRKQINHIESVLKMYDATEASALLELAAWKARCTQYKPSVSVEAVDNGSNAFGSTAFKENCLIMCGSNPIVPNVLSFL